MTFVIRELVFVQFSMPPILTGAITIFLTNYFGKIPYLLGIIGSILMVAIGRYYSDINHKNYLRQFGNKGDVQIHIKKVSSASYFPSFVAIYYFVIYWMSIFGLNTLKKLI